MAIPAKKLLVLDVNGFLLDTYFNCEKRPDRPADGKVNSHFVYRRPHCNEFIEFCFEKFEVGIWSSAQRHNVDKFVDFIFGDLKSKLLFSWHQTECTDTGLKSQENRRKPVFLKELSKLWNKMKPDLPWEKGDYGPFNTLLIDDSPYKALRNPPHTAVFPYPYKVSNDLDDVLGGALRKYLEGLAAASNVQHYVKHHTFGQPPISKESPNWYFYSQILLPMKNQEAIWAPSCQEYELQSISLEDREVGVLTGNGQHSKSDSHIAKQKKKHRLDLVNSTNQYSVTGMEKEENCVVEAAMHDMEKSISLEDREQGLKSVKEQHSESGSRIGKRKKKHRVSPMEGEENCVVEAAMHDVEKSISLEDREVGLQSGKEQHSESGSHIGKQKKKHRVSPMEREETCVVEGAMHDMEKSTSLEDREVGLQCGKDQRSESGLSIGKRKKKHRVSPMEREENCVVEPAIHNIEKSISLEDREVDLQSGKEQHSESGLHNGKQKKKHRVPRMEREENDVTAAAMALMEASKGITQASLSEFHKSYNLFRGAKDADLLSDHGEHPKFGLAQKRKRKFHQATSISRESPPDMGSEGNGLAEIVETCTARGNGTPAVYFSQEHEAHNMLPKDELAAQTDEDRCRDNTSTKSARKFCGQNNFRHVNKSHHYKSSHFSKDYHTYSNRHSSSHFQMNRYGSSRDSYFPGRQFQKNWGHRNGVNASLETQVEQGGIYASNNMYGSNAVHSNIPQYQRGGYINDRKVLWPTQQGHRWGSLQYVPHGQTYNPGHVGSTVFQGQSYNPNQGATELQGPGHNWNRIGGTVMQSPLSSFLSHEQMDAPFYRSQQYQGHGRRFKHRNTSSSSKHYGRM